MIPELPEIPELQAQQIAALRMQTPGTPQMPNLRTESILGYDPRAQEAAEYAAAVGIAYEISRRQDALMRAIARKEEQEEAKYYRY